MIWVMSCQCDNIKILRNINRKLDTNVKDKDRLFFANSVFSSLEL